MNTVCALLLVFALGFASAAPAIKVAAYAGTTDGTNTWTPPTTSPTCAAGTVADVKYEIFPLTIAAAGVYQVRCIYEQVWRTTGRALVYSGTFAPATPCQGFVHEAVDSLGIQGGPRKNDGVYLTAGAYTVVVTGDSATSTGLFACNVMQSSINTNTTGSALMINPVNNEQSDSCSSSSNVVSARAVTWTQETTGLYDINVYFSNTSYDATTAGEFGANAVIFKGDVVALMNETVNDPCDAKFQAAYHIGGDLSGKFVVILQNVSLTAGQNYTAVVSGGNPAAMGYVGISVDPTIIRSNVDSAGTWTQPSRSVDAEECEDSTYTNQPTYAYTFVAEYPTYIFDTQLTQWDSASFDTFSFLYSGINNATVPQTCGGQNGVRLLYYGDTGDVRPLAFLGLNVGQYYTVIVSCYSSSPSRGPFAVYAMTGSQIGVVPTGTATSTTGEPSESSFLGVSLLLLVIAAIFTAF